MYNQTNRGNWRRGGRLGGASGIPGSTTVINAPRIFSTAIQTGFGIWRN